MIQATIAYVRELFAGESSGHDFEHTMRVYQLAIRIAEQEGADADVVGLSALLHDVDDRKLSPETCENMDRTRHFLKTHGVEPELTERICRIIGEVSFKGTDSVKPTSLEGCCVQDADRLDAMGAVGIARAFAFGGSRGRKMYDPQIQPNRNMDAAAYAANEGTTVNHFYEKLLLLEAMMTTDTGRRLAKQRHRFMEQYLEQFFKEWNGEI